MATAVLDTFDLATISPPEAKLLINAYDAIFQEGLATFNGKNSLGDIVSLNQYGITSVITQLSVGNHLEPDEVIKRLRELAAVATQENTTTSLDQQTLDSLIATHEEHLQELRRIDEKSVAQVENRLQRISRVAKRSGVVYSAAQPPVKPTISQAPDVTATLEQVQSLSPDTPEYVAAVHQLETAISHHLPPEGAENAPLVAANLLRRSQPSAVPTPPAFATISQQLTEIARSHNIPPSDLEQVAAPITTALEAAKTATTTTQYEAATQKLENTLAPFISDKENLHTVAIDLARRATPVNAPTIPISPTPAGPSIPTTAPPTPLITPKIDEAIKAAGLPPTQQTILTQKLTTPEAVAAVTEASQDVQLAARTGNPQERAAAVARFNTTITQIVADAAPPVAASAIAATFIAAQIHREVAPDQPLTEVQTQRVTENIQARLNHTLGGVLPPESINSLGQAITAQTVSSRFGPPSQPLNPEAITATIVSNSISETLTQLPLSDNQRKQVETLLQSHDTLTKVVTQIHHPDHLVPGQTITETEVDKLHNQIKAQLEHDLEGKLSPPALSALTGTIVGQALPVAKISTELQLAQKSGGALIASEALASFPPEVLKIQSQIEWIHKNLSPEEAQKVIAGVLKTTQIASNKRDLVNVKDLEAQVRAGLHPDTIRVLQSGLTAEGLTDAIQKGTLPSTFAEKRNQMRNAQSGAVAAGAVSPQTTFQRLFPIKGVSIKDGQLHFSVASAEKTPRSFRLYIARRLGSSQTGDQISPRQVTSVPTSPEKSPFPLFSPNALLNTSRRLQSAQKLLTSTQGKLLLRFRQSFLGRLNSQFSTFIREQVVNKITAWVGKQTVVIAAKSALGFIGRQVALSTARATIIKAAAKETLKKLAVKATTTILTRLGFEVVAGATVAPVVGWVIALADLGWQLLKNVIFNPKFWKKLFNWLSDRPWVLAAMLAAPLFLGAPGFFIAGLGGLALLGIGLTGGTAALIGMGGVAGAGIVGLLGLIFAPVIIPAIIIIAIFFGSWLFLTIFYLLFILPQGFMTNQTARQIALIATENPVYLTVTKNASPKTISNGAVDQIATTPITVSYTITLVPDKDTSLTNIKFTDKITDVKITHVDNAQGGYNVIDIPSKLPANLPLSASPGEVKTVTYSLVLDNKFNPTPPALHDSLLVNQVEVSFDAQNKYASVQGLTRTAQTSVIIGDPKVTVPTGWPVWGPDACVTQGPNTPAGNTHHGVQAIDIGTPTGTNVHATHDGITSTFYGYPFGTHVVITSPDNLYSTLYAHLSKILITPGIRVSANTIIGLSGNTGYSTGPHLHYQLKGSPPSGPLINTYLQGDPPAPIPSVTISGCTYQGKDYHVTHQ